MKQFIACLLSLCMVLSCLTGCSPAKTEEAENSAAAEETAAATQDSEEASGAAETETEEDPSSAIEIQTVRTGDMEMDYITFGSGEETFVILPGLSVHSVLGSADAVAAAYESFTGDYTVYLFDRAKDIDAGYTVRDMADDTAAAMEALGLQDADIFGASQGGMIALYLAIDHPALVHKMILGSTLAKPNDTFTQVITEWLDLAAEKDETALLGSFADKVYSQATLDAYRDVLISSNLGISDEEYARFCILAEACLTFDCYDELSAITCPVLVLGSEGDQVVTAEGSRQIADALSCECYLYDDSYGHGVYDEAADYRDRCLDFLRAE